MKTKTKEAEKKRSLPSPQLLFRNERKFVGKRMKCEPRPFFFSPVIRAAAGRGQLVSFGLAEETNKVVEKKNKKDKERKTPRRC